MMQGDHMDNYFFGKPEKTKYEYNGLTKISEFESKYVVGENDKYVFIDADNPVFDMGGILRPSENHGEYYRMDVARRDDYVDGKDWLSRQTSGGSLRFYTDAKEISLKVKYRSVSLGMHHFCDRGVYGFDMYTGSGTDRKYCGAMMQTFADDPNENEKTLVLHGDPTEVLIEFPLYGGIETLAIGFPKDASVARPAPRAYKPVAFYGSSITQGGCVSRPASMYSNIICRALDCDNVNLGFSGSAFGEQFCAEWLAKRDISCFVMDYDYNARSLDELQNTHLPFYETVRKAHPDIPVVFVTHPTFWETNGNDIKRVNIVKATYELALSKGENVYFVNGCEFFPSPMKDLFCVDNLHPNDLGHYYMAKAIYPVVKDALKG